MASTIASQQEAAKARIPLAYRDQCSALVPFTESIIKLSLTDWFRLLIPLNKCRRQGNYMQWNCEHERHEYEKCQYDDLLRRMRQLSKIKKERAAGGDDE
ncbi:NADH-ubiquinone oxidoreductase B18 subunit-domain-containing protein [Rhizoctonia solani]|nr:NADH-ubiquinone oxidoreductase B18 subunit-domain-containing protein [Rhizoctonia solani]